MIKKIKETKKKIDKAIIFFEDPETGAYRRILFGDDKKIMDFFIENSQILMHRWARIQAHGFKDTQSLMKAFKKTRMKGEETHHNIAADKLVMNLTYEVEEVSG